MKTARWNSRVLLAGILAVAAFVSAQSQAHAAIISGTTTNIDGDGDNLVDDLRISRITFDVTAGTTVAFDSLVWEYTGVDLNGDGFITGFDAYVMILDSAGNFLGAVDDYSTGGFLNINGSVHVFDSAIQYTFGTAGTYIVTIGQLAYTNLEAFQGYDPDRPYFDYTFYNPVPVGGQNWGAWRLDITWTGGAVTNITRLDDDYQFATPIPEPSSLALLGLGAIGFVASAARRRRVLPG